MQLSSITHLQKHFETGYHGKMLVKDNCNTVIIVCSETVMVSFEVKYSFKYKNIFEKKKNINKTVTDSW